MENKPTIEKKTIGNLNPKFISNILLLLFFAFVLEHHLSQFFWWIFNTDFTWNIWSSDISFYNNWSDYTPLSNQLYYCIYYRNPEFIYGVAYLPHFFILWYPMWSLFTYIPYWGYIIEIIILESINIVCFVSLFVATWRKRDLTHILALSLANAWIYWYGMCLNVEFLIFVVYFFVMKSLAKREDTKMILINAFLVALFSFKIFSLFFIPIMIVQMKSNWKRLFFFTCVVVFIFLLNYWYWDLCSDHILNPYYRDDFLSNNPAALNRQSVAKYLELGDYYMVLIVLKFTFLLRPSSSFGAIAFGFFILQRIPKIFKKWAILSPLSLITQWSSMALLYTILFHEVWGFMLASGIIVPIYLTLKYQKYQSNSTEKVTGINRIDWIIT